jgi:hypothetical protein
VSHIFVSYSHKDTQYVYDLTAELEKRGFLVWLDEHIPKGARWFQEIQKAIADCIAMIVVMSPDAEESEWVEQEIILARSQNKNIFPLLLRGECFPILIARQFTDITTGSLPDDEFYEQLSKPSQKASLPSSQTQNTATLSNNPNSTINVFFDEQRYYQDTYAFQEHLNQLLERGNNIGFRRYLREAPQIFFSHIQNLPNSETETIQRLIDDKLKPILDKLVVMGITSIEYNIFDIFREVVEVLHTIFTRAYGFDFPKASDSDLHFSVSWLWQEIIVRVFVLGAVLVKQRRFQWIRYLVRQEVSWDEYYRKFYWARFILIVLRTEKRLPKKSLCPPAVELIKNNKHLSSIFFGNEDTIISTTCQFDFLQAINVLQEGKDPYPSFGAYYNHRTEPIIRELIEKTPAREAIGDTSDHDLAKWIYHLDQYAGMEFFSSASWDSNFWSDRSISEFLERNLRLGDNIR